MSCQPQCNNGLRIMHFFSHWPLLHQVSTWDRETGDKIRWQSPKGLVALPDSTRYLTAPWLGADKGLLEAGMTVWERAVGRRRRNTDNRKFLCYARPALLLLPVRYSNWSGWNVTDLWGHSFQVVAQVTGMNNIPWKNILGDEPEMQVQGIQNFTTRKWDVRARG